MTVTVRLPRVANAVRVRRPVNRPLRVNWWLLAGVLYSALVWTGAIDLLRRIF